MTEDTPAETGHARAIFWRRFGQVYQTVALICFNTVLFSVIVLVILTLMMPANDDLRVDNGDIKAAGMDATYSGYFNRAAYYLSSPDQVSETLADYDAMARAGHWMVHPWTGLTMRPFQSRYLNIDSNGRRVGPQVDSAYNGKLPLVVWAFGGSTLFGWGLADQFSIPALLQIELQKRLPERQVKVVNFAEPIYNSSQEIALFIANLRNSKPDMAFFFDGVNDMWYTLYANTQTPLIDPLAAVWEKNTYEVTHPQQEGWLTFHPSFPPLRLAQLLGIPINRETNDTGVQYAMHGIYKPTYNELLAASVHNYITNGQMSDAIGTALHVKTFFFLQPYPSDPNDFPKFRELVDKQTEMPNFYDISTVLDGKLPNHRKSLIDDFHYSDYASGIIADKIADILLRPNH